MRLRKWSQPRSVFPMLSVSNSTFFHSISICNMVIHIFLHADKMMNLKIEVWSPVWLEHLTHGYLILYCLDLVHNQSQILRQGGTVLISLWDSKVSLIHFRVVTSQNRLHTVFILVYTVIPLFQKMMIRILSIFVPFQNCEHAKVTRKPIACKGHVIILVWDPCST